MPPKKITPPKPKNATPAAGGAAKPAAKAQGAGSAAKPKTATTTTTPTSGLSEQQKKFLITSQTSPQLVKKAFQKIMKLLQALGDEMDQPLPPKVLKAAKVLDAEGFVTLSKRLSHAVTRYVLFVCQEGTITSVEHQSQALLTVIRDVCLSLRVLLNQSGETLQGILIETGTTILEELGVLFKDLASQIDAEWKRCVDSTTGKFNSPLNDDNRIVQITARVWKSCEKLSNIPLTDQAAVAMRCTTELLPMIKDAVAELKAVEVADYDLPKEEEEEEEEQQQQQQQQQQQNDLPHLPKLVDQDTDTTTINTTDDSTPNAKNDENFTQTPFSRTEHQWVQNGIELANFASSVIDTFANKILPNMKHPNRVAGSEIVDLTVAGAPARQKAFIRGLEQRYQDITCIAEYVDTMSGCLYSPQDVPTASKYAWCIFSKLSRLLLWLDNCYKIGWLRDVFAVNDINPVFMTEVTPITAETTDFTTFNIKDNELTKLYVTFAEWYADPIINPQLRQKVTGEGSDIVAAVKSTTEQYKRLHEFDHYVLPPVSPWLWINFNRKTMFSMFYKRNTTKFLTITPEDNVICVTEVTEDGEDGDKVNYPVTNLLLQHLVFQQFPYLPIGCHAAVEATNEEFCAKPQVFPEYSLYDDIEDMDDDDEFDDDEDEDDGDIYFFD